MAGSPAEQALAVLRTTEGNILSQWHAEGREVFEPFGPWLAEVRRVAELLETSSQEEPAVWPLFLGPLSEHPE